MPGIVPLLSLVSTQLNAALIGCNLPPLVDGAIVLGAQHLNDNSDVPRVIFVPRGSKFGPRAQGSRSNHGANSGTVSPGAGVAAVAVTDYGAGYVSPVVTFTGGGTGSGAAAVAVLNANGSLRAVAMTANGSGYTSEPTVVITDAAATVPASVASRLLPSAEKQAEISNRSIMTDTLQFLVHCQGIGLTPDYANDYDATQLLYQQVIASAFNIAGGVTRAITGQWSDSKPRAAQVLTRGREYVFLLEIDTPVVDTPMQAAGFAPVGVQPALSFYIVPSGGGNSEAP